MSERLDIRKSLVEVLPALLVVVVASLVMTSQVGELDGRLVVLLGAGVLGVAGASRLLPLLRGPIAAPVPLLPPPAAEALAPPAAPRPAPALVEVVQPASIDGFESFSLAKEGNEDDENEDSVAVGATTGTIAIADGASSSFGARVWSQALVDVAVASSEALAPPFAGSVMAPAATTWAEAHSGADMPWWAQEGLRRGGFATLLVVRIGHSEQGRGWQALAVGDSCLFHLRPSAGGCDLVRAFPLETAEAFGSHPVLLSSVSPAPTDGVELASGRLEPGDVLIAATDAVSEWLLGDSWRLAVAASAPIDELSAAVRSARRSREMVNDDATFVRFVER